MEGDRWYSETTMVSGWSELVSPWGRGSVEKVLIVNVWRGWGTTSPSCLIGVSVVGAEGHVLLAGLLHLWIRLLGLLDLWAAVMWGWAAGEHGAHGRLVVAHVQREWH